MKTQRKDMTNREYEQHARSEAAAYGNSVGFWVRQGDPKEAARLARLAARWALRVQGREA